jgi:hypothetical protein
MFVPWVRIMDQTRKVYVLQGDDIAGVSPDFATACRDFQVKWIFLEDVSEGGQDSKKIRSDVADYPFELIRYETFGPSRSGVGLKIYRYQGPIAKQMKTIPLRSEVQGVQHEVPFKIRGTFRDGNGRLGCELGPGGPIQLNVSVR